MIFPIYEWFLSISLLPNFQTWNGKIRENESSHNSPAPHHSPVSWQTEHCFVTCSTKFANTAESNGGSTAIESTKIN